MTFVSTEGKCKSEDERKVNAKIDDERKAAQNAKAVLDCLIPSNARTNRIIFLLRNAANIARTATLTRLESKRALDAMRTEAATSLNQTCGLLDRGGLTQEAIYQAAGAVTAWLNALPRSKVKKFARVGEGAMVGGVSGPRRENCRRRRCSGPAAASAFCSSVTGKAEGWVTAV